MKPLYAALFILLGWVLAWRPDSEPQGLVVDHALTARVEALEARTTEIIKVRCMRIEAERLDIMIIPSENLGKQKVPAPSKPSTTMAEVVP